LNILKWVLIVLAAGFVGQFGKRLADHFIRRARDRRARNAFVPPPRSAGDESRREGTAGGESPARVDGQDQASPALGPFDAKVTAKIAKRAAKAEVKRRKKTPA
jgi:hypothetical protein